MGLGTLLWVSLLLQGLNQMVVQMPTQRCTPQPSVILLITSKAAQPLSLSYALEGQLQRYICFLYTKC